MIYLIRYKCKIIIILIKYNINNNIILFILYKFIIISYMSFAGKHWKAQWSMKAIYAFRALLREGDIEGDDLFANSEDPLEETDVLGGSL
jgi:hypothetical protein